MTTDSKPTTAAGRALLYALGRRSWSREAFRQSILAIEAEYRQPSPERSEKDSEALRTALANLVLDAWNGAGGEERLLARLDAILAALSPSDPPALDLADFANAVKGRCEISGDHYVYPRSVPMLLKAAETHGIALSAQPEAQPAEDADGPPG